MSVDTPCCPVSNSSRLLPFFEMKQAPVMINVLYESHHEATTVTRGDIVLSFCEESGHVFNQSFDESLLDYSLEYNNTLHHSPRFQEYAEELCENLVDQFDLRGKSIIDVGCGHGDFLRLICEVGGCTGHGFDPSYRPRKQPEPAGVDFSRSYFSPENAPKQIDFVCCRHVLEHIKEPREFLRMLRKSVGASREVTFFFEVPNALFMLRNMAIWDIIYEHCSYYTPTSLRRLFCGAGFEVLDVRERFGGQFLTLCARPAPPTSEAFGDTAPLRALVKAFRSRYQDEVTHVHNKLLAARAAGRSAVIWGAGSKGITFLNVLGSSETIRYAIDINTSKHGKYVAGTGQPIHPPERIQTEPADIVLIMNPIYESEIRQAVASFGIGTEFWLL